MRLLVVRCLAFVVVRAVMRERGSSGALCATGAASSALTGEKILHAQFRRSLLRSGVRAGVRSNGND